jgi:hypothetical protein
MLAPSRHCRKHVSAQDRNGETPIQWAAFNGHADVIKALQEVGADDFSNGRLNQHSGPSPTTRTSAEYLQPKSSQSGLDPRVQTVKLADDPGRSETSGDDRPHESYSDRRPEPPSPFRPGPITPISSAPNPYPPYRGHPEQPPPGFGPYDRPRSPPRPYPFPHQSATYPPPYQPPLPLILPPPLPPPSNSLIYLHVGLYDYSGLPPPGSTFPPRTMPSSRLPQGGMTNTPISGVLYMTFLNLEPPPTHRFKIPPGAET